GDTRRAAGDGCRTRAVSHHAARRRDGAVWLARLLEMALPPDDFTPPAVDGRASVRGISGLIPFPCTHFLPKANRIRPTPSETEDQNEAQLRYCDMRLQKVARWASAAAILA